MRWIVLFIIVWCIVGLAFAGIVSANADEFDSLGIRHSSNPNVCIFEPHPLFTDDQSGIINVSYNAINLWKDKMYEYMPNGDWEMPIYLIDIEDHHTKNALQFPTCNIMISFEYVNEEASSLGYTGIMFNKSSHKFTHIVVFTHDLRVTTHFEFDLTKLDHEEVRTSVNITPHSLTAIQNIITHEFGHGLGLGHYKITDYPIYPKDTPWLDASVMYYSMNPEHTGVMIPTYVDIKMVEMIYGTDGFGGEITPPFKTGYYQGGDDDICTHKCSIIPRR